MQDLLFGMAQVVERLVLFRFQEWFDAFSGEGPNPPAETTRSASVQGGEASAAKPLGSVFWAAEGRQRGGVCVCVCVCNPWSHRASFEVCWMILTNLEVYHVVAVERNDTH